MSVFFTLNQKQVTTGRCPQHDTSQAKQSCRELARDLDVLANGGWMPRAGSFLYPSWSPVSRISAVLQFFWFYIYIYIYHIWYSLNTKLCRMCVELIMIMIDVIFHTTVHFRAPKICRSRHHCQVPPHRRANFCRGGCSGNRRTRFWSCCRWWPTRRTRSCAKEQLGTTEGPLSGKQGRATPQRRLINVEIKWNGLDHFLRLEIETGYPPASDMLLHRMWLDIATITTYPGGL